MNHGDALLIMLRPCGGALGNRTNKLMLVHKVGVILVINLVHCNQRFVTSIGNIEKADRVDLAVLNISAIFLKHF